MEGLLAGIAHSEQLNPIEYAYDTIAIRRSEPW